MVDIAPVSSDWLYDSGPIDYGRPLESAYRAEHDTIWIDSDPLYGRWRWRPSPRVLWITGPPACGKSVLARHLVESEKALDEDLMLCYYFFPEDATGGISRFELLCRSIFKQILKLDPEASSRLPPPGSLDDGGFDRLSFIVNQSGPAGDTATVDKQKPSFICILDGLDDVSDAEHNDFYRLFSLATVSPDQRYDVKFLITARFIHPSLQPEPDDSLTMVIRLEEHKTEFDRCLERYLRRRLSELGVSDPDEARLAKLKVALDGSFLATNDVMTPSVVTGAEGVDVLDRLCEAADTFPESLCRAYKSTFTRIGKHQENFGRRDDNLVRDLLVAVAIATRPLTPSEILDAFSSRIHTLGDPYLEKDHGQRMFILQHCQGLVCEESPGYTLVSGFRIRDFVGELVKVLHPENQVEEYMNLVMAQMCLSSITLSSRISPLVELVELLEQLPKQELSPDSIPWDKILSDSLRQHPFLNYASTNWAIHLDVADVSLDADIASGLNPSKQYSVQEKVFRVAEDYCDPNSPRFLTWFPLFWQAAHPTTPLMELNTDMDGLTKLMVASYISFTIGVQQILASNQGSTITRQDRRGRTALHIAVARGHFRTVRAFNGRHQFRGLLRRITNGKDVVGQTALHYAVKHKHHGVLVALMGFPGIDLNAQDAKGRTALHYAAYFGEDGMVWGLLDGNAAVDIEDSTDYTPSDYAKKVLALVEEGRMDDDDLADKYTRLSAVVHLLEKAEMAGIWLSDMPLAARQVVDNLFEIESTIFTRRFDSKHHDRFPVWDFLRHKVTEWASDQRLQRGVGWLHVPANNMTWVEILIKKLEPHRIRMGTRERILRKEFWSNCQHRGSPGYYHATFMNPQCHPLQPGDVQQQALCLYMPYIHWETMETMLKMSGTLGMMREHQIHEFEEPKRENRHEALMFYYLDRPNPLHIRRTLDQYHYYNLEDTTMRDKDQLFCRVFAEKPPGNRPVLMVDQLWLWRLPDGTVITSFPDRWSRDGSQLGREDHLDRYDRTDVFKNIKRKLDSVRSSNDLITLVIGECLKAFSDTTRQAGTFPNVLEIYGNEIGRITDTEARLLKDFSQNVKNLTNTTPRKEAVDIVDPVMEMELLREIKDIVDELQTMNKIFNDQRNVLENLREVLDEKETARDEISQRELRMLVRSRQREATLMIGQAHEASQALNDLIDLKQKFSNVLEARWARNMAEETSRQGTTILVFTIVTIVFLPLSFMAAFFALDISQFPKMEDGGLDLDFVSTYIFSMSAAVVVPLLLIAFNVDWVTRLRDSTKATILDKSEIVSKEDAYFKNRNDRMQKKKETMRQRLRKLRAAESAPKNTRGTKPSLPLATFFRYTLVILPIGEVRFACLVLLKGAEILRLRDTAVKRPPGLLAGDDEDDDSTEGVVDVGETEKTARWKIRPGLKSSWRLFLRSVRLLFLPLWISMLCVEVLIGGIVYGLLAVVLAENPLKSFVGEVWNSTLLSLYW
ncbi:hypothetical protein V8F20_008606 [Naviculisporaceae sp. PSN 640]